MKVKYSFFCDAANIDSSGKVSALGIFTTIGAQQFPAVHSMMTFVAGIEVRVSEAGKHPFRINFIDDDGKAIMPQIHGEFDVNSSSPIANILIGINSLSFPRPGTYALDLVIDNQVIISESLKLTLQRQ